MSTSTNKMSESYESVSSNVPNTKPALSKCHLLSVGAGKMSLWCQPDCHHLVCNRPFVYVGMGRGSCCYQENWRSDGLLCLWRASTLSMLKHRKSPLHPIPDIRSVYSGNWCLADSTHKGEQIRGVLCRTVPHLITIAAFFRFPHRYVALLMNCYLFMDHTIHIFLQNLDLCQQCCSCLSCWWKEKGKVRIGRRQTSESKCMWTMNVEECCEGLIFFTCIQFSMNVHWSQPLEFRPKFFSTKMVPFLVLGSCSCWFRAS